MGLGRKELAILQVAVRMEIIKPPFTKAYRIPMREALSEYEPSSRWNREIDILKMTKEAVEVWEIKSQANPDAIGRLQLYKSILGTLHFTSKPIHLILLCTQIDPDLYTLCQTLNIKVEQVKPSLL